MATKQSTTDYLLDQLHSVKDIRARKMFGEYALYAEGTVVGFVCDDELLVKITEVGKKFVGKNYKEGRPYPGAKAYMLIEADLLENREFLSELILITAKALPKPKLKKQ